MANRFPLVLDTTDNNKIKEIQAGDNLNLTDNSITGVQNITALGTIDAADMRVNGNRLVAQTFSDLTDTPASFVGSPNFFVKVKADGTGLEYRPLSDLGNIEIDTITVDTSIVPSTGSTGNIGTIAAKFGEIVSENFKGDLAAFDGSVAFNATTGKVSYAALQGAPTFLSEFTDDIGYITVSDLNAEIQDLFDDGLTFNVDITGSIFGNDSTLLVDALGSVITGDVLNTSVDTVTLNAGTVIAETDVVSSLVKGTTTGNLTIEADNDNSINIGLANTAAVNIYNAVMDVVDQGSGLGIAQITADTDLAIAAGNRVKIAGGVPFKVANITTTDQASIAAQNGDIIYNATTNKFQGYAGGTWVNLH